MENSNQEEQKLANPATAAPQYSTDDLAGIVEALLFACDQPVPLSRLAEITGADEEQIRTVITTLNQTYADTGRAFRITRVAHGYQLYTLPEYADWIRKLYQHQRVQRLSPAALEVLAIIAYQQPVTKPEIEKLRGVDCSAPLLTLLERGLIVTAGRAHRPGNPFLYRTTREFLRYFGLESLDELPNLEELSTFLAERETPDSDSTQSTS
ncbi:SMC-Scp complex subunit ScpB [candidate division WOR-3 bacterium]|nr:SMC-Scp complex subunit ScpB [candidate division WOR-3 bacterium]